MAMIRITRTTFFGGHMKVTRLVLFAVLFSTLLVSLRAQTTAQPTVALIDTRVFYHNPLGINRLLQAYRQLQTEFAPRQAELQVMQDRIVALNNEINKLGASAATKLKEEELLRLQRDFQYRKQEADAAFDKRRLVLLQPIQQHISKALQAFIAARGITILLDTSKVEDALLAIVPSADLTRAFIDEYNAKYPASNGVATNR